MSTPGLINKMILSTFDAMEEGVDYELIPDAFSEFNKTRKKLNYGVIKPFVFQRKGGSLIIDWKDNDWGTDTVKVDRDNQTLAFTASLAPSFPLPLAFAGLTLAFAENCIQKVATTCEGKTVVIEGVEYELRIKK